MIKNFNTSILEKSFYTRTDVLVIARELLGKWLMTKINGLLTGGMIIETEAYKGPEDLACHAYGNRRTQRTEIMFAEGGHAYVYLCYGIHHLFNIVTGPKNTPHAVLIRALKPDCGIDHMENRRSKNRQLTAGPGVLCQALGITRIHNGTPLLTPDLIWIEDRGFTPMQIRESQRIGVDYAGEDALLPWRFHL